MKVAKKKEEGRNKKKLKLFTRKYKKVVGTRKSTVGFPASFFVLVFFRHFMWLVLQSRFCDSFLLFQTRNDYFGLCCMHGNKSRLEVIIGHCFHSVSGHSCLALARA